MLGQALSEDLDELGLKIKRWKAQTVHPAQLYAQLMSMIPKKVRGAIRFVAAMGSGWRNDTKLESQEDIERGTGPSHTKTTRLSQARLV